MKIKNNFNNNKNLSQSYLLKNCLIIDNVKNRILKNDIFIKDKIIDYIDIVKMDIISVDYNIDMQWLIKNLNTDIILQGNLDPNKINRGGKELEDAVNKLLLNTKDRKHIYCSGHGLLPNTPTKNVERVIEIIKN